ncbi:MAG: hypothetical protein ACPH4K_08535, partial [Flavobacteriaceae bacterium]
NAKNKEDIRLFVEPKFTFNMDKFKDQPLLPYPPLHLMPFIPTMTTTLPTPIPLPLLSTLMSL